jgi:superfamily I DNA/RNA helicase
MVPVTDPTEDLLAGISGNYSNVAILCRSNKECARWQLTLAYRNLPVYLVGQGEFWNQKQIKLAKDAWSMRQSEQQLFDSEAWTKFITQKKYTHDDDLADEVRSDAKWIMGLQPEQMQKLQNTLNRESDGIRIATIHKTKGMEFDRVLISGCGERLQNDTFVYYVAVTRPRELLILA